MITTKDTIRYLKNNEDMVVTQAEKGNIAIIMYKEEYERKVLDVLKVKHTYHELKEKPDPLKYNERYIKFLYKLMNKK